MQEELYFYLRRVDFIARINHMRILKKKKELYKFWGGQMWGQPPEKSFEEFWYGPKHLGMRI
jgi:hypothetical protein